MKKKKILFIITLLLIVIIPASIIFGSLSDLSLSDARKLFGTISMEDAALKCTQYTSDHAAQGYGCTVSTGYDYYMRSFTAKQITGKDIIPTFYVAGNRFHKSTDEVWFHEAQKNNKYYSGFCLHISAPSNARIDGVRQKMTAFIYDKEYPVGALESSNGGKKNDGTYNWNTIVLNRDKLDLLQALLGSGYQFSKDHQNSITGSAFTTAVAKKMFVKQILVWEIVEGGRTNFSKEEPTYHDNNSAYKSIILKNQDLHEIYALYITEANDYLDKINDNSLPSIFDGTYTMKWDSKNKIYTTGAVEGLGDFSGCKSTNSKLTVSTNKDKKTVTVTSKEKVSNAEITCYNVKGDGENKWSYYKINNHNDYQEVINGVAGITKEAKFNVQAETGSIKIVKKDPNGNKVNNVQFTLTKLYEDGSVDKSVGNNGVISLKGNDDTAKDLPKSELYLLEEKVPSGYTGIPTDTGLRIRFNLKTGESNCTKPGTDRNGNRTCLNGMVTVQYNATKKLFTLLVINEKIMNVKIIKTDENGKNIDNVSFSLTKLTDDSTEDNEVRDKSVDVINLTGNKGAQRLPKPELYKLHESEPANYDGIDDTRIRFRFNDPSQTNCTNPGHDSSGNLTCQGGKITIKYSEADHLFTITVKNTKVANKFVINKKDKDGNGIKNATFTMHTGADYNTPVKFNQSNNTFTYNTNGTVTNIVANASSYTILDLPEGKYKIVETAVPSPYVLAGINDRTSYIKVEYKNNEYKYYSCSDSACSKTTLIDSKSITAVNYKTQVKVFKSGDKGVKLKGVQYILYKKVNNNNVYINSSASSGEYSYSTEVNSRNSATVYVTDANGKIVVNNLPAGSYIFEEVGFDTTINSNLANYVLPEDLEDRCINITIQMLKTGPKYNSSNGTYQATNRTEDNETYDFNFYKVDEDGNYLTGGKFKLQKYNTATSKYEDIKVKTVRNDGTYMDEADIFEPDNSGKVEFTLTNGVATFINLEKNTTYRVLEVEAPKGFSLADSENSVIVTIDSNGYAKGNSTIVNTKKSLEGSTAQAELIIAIQTGQTVIRYGVIIIGTLVLISSLMAILIVITKKRK